MDKIKEMIPGAHKTHHGHTTAHNHKQTGIVEKIAEKVIPGAHHNSHSHTTGGTHKTGIAGKIAEKVVPGAHHQSHSHTTTGGGGGIVEQIKDKLPGGHHGHKHY